MGEPARANQNYDGGDLTESAKETATRKTAFKPACGVRRADPGHARHIGERQSQLIPNPEVLHDAQRIGPVVAQMGLHLDPAGDWELAFHIGLQVGLDDRINGMVHPTLLRS
jgi:hypothetical protein